MIPGASELRRSAERADGTNFKPSRGQERAVS
jgi:hypothetical protein